MTTIVLAVILGLVAVGCFVFGVLQLNGKGPLFNNAYIWASQQEREAMDKRPYYRQSGIIFLLIGLLFVINTVYVICKIDWLLCLLAADVVGMLGYAIISSVIIEKRKH